MSRLREVQEDVAGVVSELTGFPCSADVVGQPQPETAVVRPAPGDWLSSVDGTFCNVGVSLQVVILVSGGEIQMAQEVLGRHAVTLFTEMRKRKLQRGGQCPGPKTAGRPSSVDASATLLGIEINLNPIIIKLS